MKISEVREKINHDLLIRSEWSAGKHTEYRQMLLDKYNVASCYFCSKLYFKDTMKTMQMKNITLKACETCAKKREDKMKEVEKND